MVKCFVHKTPVLHHKFYSIFWWLGKKSHYWLNPCCQLQYFSPFAPSTIYWSHLANSSPLDFCVLYLIIRILMHVKTWKHNFCPINFEPLKGEIESIEKVYFIKSINFIAFKLWINSSNNFKENVLFTMYPIYEVTKYYIICNIYFISSL